MRVWAVGMGRVGESEAVRGGQVGLGRMAVVGIKVAVRGKKHSESWLRRPLARLLVRRDGRPR